MYYFCDAFEEVFYRIFNKHMSKWNASSRKSLIYQQLGCIRFRYEVLLGIPWQTKTNPNVNYSTTSVIVDVELIPNFDMIGTSENTMNVTSTAVPTFRSLLRKHGGRNDCQLYHSLPTNNLISPKGGNMIPR